MINKTTAMNEEENKNEIVDGDQDRSEGLVVLPCADLTCPCRIMRK
jgi:hypothetical protein